MVGRMDGTIEGLFDGKIGGTEGQMDGWTKRSRTCGWSSPLTFYGGVFRYRRTAFRPRKGETPFTSQVLAQRLCQRWTLANILCLLLNTHNHRQTYTPAHKHTQTFHRRACGCVGVVGSGWVAPELEIPHSRLCASPRRVNEGAWRFRVLAFQCIHTSRHTTHTHTCTHAHAHLDTHAHTINQVWVYPHSYT